MLTKSPFFHRFLHSADLIEAALRERLNRIGVRPKQARVIDALAHMEPTTQVALAREFHVTPASMSTMTARLIDGGFITREVDPDEARSNTLRLTERGRGLLSDIYVAWADIDAMIIAHIGADKAAQLEALTLELRNSLGGRAPGRTHASKASPILENET